MSGRNAFRRDRPRSRRGTARHLGWKGKHKVEGRNREIDRRYGRQHRAKHALPIPDAERGGGGRCKFEDCRDEGRGYKRHESIA